MGVKCGDRAPSEGEIGHSDFVSLQNFEQILIFQVFFFLLFCIILLGIT